jgi:hypothetical protein
LRGCVAGTFVLRRSDLTGVESRNAQSSWAFLSDLLRMGGGTEFVVEANMMTRHDQELLEKQLSRIEPAPPSGVLMLVIAIVFFTGMAVGSFLFAYTEEPPLRFAANDIPGTTQSQPISPLSR